MSEELVAALLRSSRLSKLGKNSDCFVSVCSVGRARATRTTCGRKAHGQKRARAQNPAHDNGWKATVAAATTATATATTATAAASATTTTSATAMTTWASTTSRLKITKHLIF